MPEPDRQLIEQEVVLHGGVANAGAVTRVGPHVLRPANPHTPTVHRFLRALRDEGGFGGASYPVGVDPDGRERLGYIPGEIALTPYPDWAQEDATLRSVTELMRGFHVASGKVSPAYLGESWSLEMADPGEASSSAGGRAVALIVCHNDVCLENVVFDGGTAVALLDFDYASPGRPLYDMAQFARMCVPVDDDLSASRLGWHPGDRPSRLRLVCDTYGLRSGERHDLLRIIDATIEAGGQFLLRQVEAGDRNFIAMWEEIGGMERFDRRRRWWAGQKDQFARALA